jgi:hypothetical protein
MKTSLDAQKNFIWPPFFKMNLPDDFMPREVSVSDTNILPIPVVARVARL